MERAARDARQSVDQRASDLPVHGLPRSARVVWQVAVPGLVGAAVAVVVSLATPVTPAYGVLLGWDIAVGLYVGWVWLTSWRLDAEATAEAAEREDPSRPIADVILLVAAVASLAAVVLAIADASSASGAVRALRVALGVATVIASWFLVHTLFSLKYAREYFTAEDGGIEFNTDQPPVWSDFAYMAFTIGMTFQISDTDLQTSTLRRIALRHMLISYLFGAVIVAVAINLVAGLTK